MLEAGCLEWSLLICIILRDTMAVVRTVNTAVMTDTPLEVVARMREGMSFVELFADTEWSVCPIAVVLILSAERLVILLKVWRYTVQSSSIIYDLCLKYLVQI